MDRKFVSQMAIGFKTKGTSMNHPPETDSTSERSPNSLSNTFDPDSVRIPLMNNHVSPTTNNQTTNNNNEGNAEIKTDDEENKMKSDKVE